MTDIRGAPSTNSSDSELIQLLASQVKSVPITVLAVLSVIALMASSYVTPVVWIGWCLVTMLTQIFRWWVLWKLPNIESIPDKKKLTIITSITFLSGGLIGLSLMFFPHFSLVEKTIHTTLLLGLGAGSLAVTVGYRPVYLAYIGTTLFPLSLVWLFITEPEGEEWMYTVLGLLILGFISVLLNLSKELYRQFNNSYNISQQFLAANEEIQAALDKVQSANEAKTRFLASASHDLRQPIHTLGLFSASLSMRPLDKKSQGIVEHMNKAIQVLTVQLDALLDISKLDAGLVETNISQVNLRSLLSHLYSEFQPIAAEKNLQLEFKTLPSATTLSDSHLLERIFRNLISNAIKYTDTGKVSIVLEENDSNFRLSIRDTGRGIPEDELLHIFEEFYQLSNPHRNREQGLGLGLSIVDRLTRLLDLEVHIESELNKGSVFYIDIDQYGELYGSQKVQIENDKNIEGLSVLVIDDEPEILEAMKVLFEDLGCNIVLASSSAQAIELANQSRPDIVLADFRLRENDNGIQAISFLRKEYPNLPAILISGDTSPQRLKEASRAGLTILHKPVLVEDITHTISTLLKNESAKSDQ